MTAQILYDNISSQLFEHEKPSIYLNEIYEMPAFSIYPFDMLKNIKNTKQSPKYHPEGDVWNHTMLVIDEAAKVKNQSKNQPVFMWAALLHDIGKPITSKNKKGKITSYDHDKVGARLSKEFLSKFTQDEVFMSEVSWLIRYHMHILFVANNLPFADLKGMKLNTDINEVALLGLCDRLGRGNSNIAEEKANIQKFLDKCKI
ncbi:MAG: HDIG domain-containing protein [Clostridia bacterium]|nr:HDIG domain-containing protein [Clostridia bacterium]